MDIKTKNRIKTLSIIIIIGIAGYLQGNLFILPISYGVGSLAQLQDEVNTNTTYRAELEDYINKSNVTLPTYPITTEQLQSIVIEIMNGGSGHKALGDIGGQHLKSIIGDYDEFNKKMGEIFTSEDD